MGIEYLSRYWLKARAVAALVGLTCFHAMYIALLHNLIWKDDSADGLQYCPQLSCIDPSCVMILLRLTCSVKLVKV